MYIRPCDTLTVAYQKKQFERERAKTSPPLDDQLFTLQLISMPYANHPRPCFLYFPSILRSIDYTELVRQQLYIEEGKQKKFMKERIKTAEFENVRESGDARWNCFTKVFVFLLAGRAEMSNISAMMTMSSTAAGASLDESLSCAGQLSNARWSNGRTQFDQPSRSDEGLLLFDTQVYGVTRRRTSCNWVWGDV